MIKRPDRDMVDVIAVADDGLLVLKDGEEIPLNGRDHRAATERSPGTPFLISPFRQVKRRIKMPV